MPIISTFQCDQCKGTEPTDNAFFNLYWFAVTPQTLLCSLQCVRDWGFANYRTPPMDANAKPIYRVNNIAGTVT